MKLLGAIIASILLVVSAGILRRKNPGQVRLHGWADQDKRPLNPSRGFYLQLSGGEAETLETLKGKVKLCLLAYDLYDFRDRDLTAEKLRELETFLKTAERKHIRCIFRAAYGFERREHNDAASFSLLLHHVCQIAPVLNAHKNQIYLVQAGFLGPWGEWHSSAYLGERKGAEHRQALVSLLLEQLDPDIPVALRRPAFIRETGEHELRLCFHNDGLLASASDLGTYTVGEDSRAESLTWMEKRKGIGPVGGEMPGITEYTEPQNVRQEFMHLHIDYLNLGYNAEIYEDWAKKRILGENALDYLSARLGYRYYISTLSYPERLARGLGAWGQKLRLTLTNEGFGEIDPRFILELIGENSQGRRHVLRQLSDLAQPVAEVSGGVLRKQGPCRLGLRLSIPGEMDPEDCAQLCNGGICFEEGINFFLEIRQDGTLVPLIPSETREL